MPNAAYMASLSLSRASSSPYSPSLLGSNGNKYYEDHTEVPGRHRWVDFAQHDVHVSQIEPVWHAWLHHTKTAPPTNDEVVLNARQTWEAVSCCGSC
jgi:NADH:ubiquinone oxidoreductase subunit